MMALIKGPISIVKFGVKAIANTAFYGLAIYGALNVATNTYALVKYIKSVQKPEQAIVQSANLPAQSIDSKVREKAAEAILGESLDQKIEKKIEERLAGYAKSRQLLDVMKSDRDYVAYDTE